MAESQLPLQPKGLDHRSTPNFDGVKYVYVRFEDFTAHEDTPPEATYLFDRFRAASDLSERESGFGSYGATIPGWVAEYLLEFGNCTLTGVWPDGTTRELKSTNYEQKR